MEVFDVANGLRMSMKDLNISEKEGIRLKVLS